MTTLHFGVIDIPYSAPKPPKKVSAAKGKKKKPLKAKLKESTSISTGDVAEILEAKYHPYEIFFNLHEKFVAHEMEKSLSDELENLMIGGPRTSDPFRGASAAIEDRFKKFLTNREMERLGYPGIPTQAALDGVNHRLLHPFAKGNPRRPSFIDTGQYQASSKVWVD